MSVVHATETGFASSEAHLFAELARMEQLVRAAVAIRKGEDLPDAERARQLRAQCLAPVSGEVIDTLLGETLLRHECPLDLQHMRARVEAIRAENAAAAWASETRGVFLRLATLGRYGGLIPMDTDLLLLSLLPAIESRFVDIIDYLEPNYRGAWMTVNLAERLLDADAKPHSSIRHRLAPDAPLRRHDLLRVSAGRSGEERPMPRWQLQPDPRVVAFLLGNDMPDERLAAFVRLSDAARDSGELCFPAERFDKLRRFLHARHVPGPAPVFHLTGVDGIGKEALAATLAAQLERPLMVIERGLLDQATPELPSIILREAAMQQAVVYWDGLDHWLSEGSAPVQQAVKHALAGYRAWFFSGSRAGWQHHGALGRRPVIEVALPTPSAEAQARCWRRATDALKPIDPDLDLASFTSNIRLTPGCIDAVGATASAMSRLQEPDQTYISRRVLLAAARQLHSRELSSLARRVSVRPAWDDLVLPNVRKQTLRDICHHVRYRHKVMSQWGFEDKLMLGRGVSALFAGPPGTGKTMAAAVLAAELGLELYHVDMAQVVSKYIGETEKHLASLFDEAEANSAILFFDEADALFSKRTEVRDSHDRYANLQTSYLLQRIDEYEGLVILATNLSKNMDEAFVRRLRFIVPFLMPDREQRLAIWKHLLPEQMPCAEDIDLKRLADSVDLSGGYLRNIALSAAYLAAVEDDMLAMHHLIAAAQQEYAKVGRVFEVGGLDSVMRDPD